MFSIDNENTYVFVESSKRIKSCFILWRVFIYCVLVISASWTAFVWITLQESYFLVKFYIVWTKGVDFILKKTGLSLLMSRLLNKKMKVNSQIESLKF